MRGGYNPAEAVTLACRCLGELCREAGISPIYSRLLESDFERIMWRISETSEDSRDYLARIDLRKRPAVGEAR